MTISYPTSTNKPQPAFTKHPQDTKMQKATLTFLLILSTLFIFGQIAIARPNLLPRGLSKQGHKLALNKRVTANGQYVPDNLLR